MDIHHAACAPEWCGMGKCRLMGTLLCSSGASRHYAMVVARNGFSIEQNKGRVDDNMREGRTWGGATVFAAGSMQMRDHCGKVVAKCISQVHRTGREVPSVVGARQRCGERKYLSASRTEANLCLCRTQHK